MERFGEPLLSTSVAIWVQDLCSDVQSPKPSLGEMDAPGHPAGREELKNCYVAASQQRIFKDGALHFARGIMADYNGWAQSHWGKAVANRIGIGTVRKFGQVVKGTSDV
jgi:hypothetical protein